MTLPAWVWIAAGTAVAFIVLVVVVVVAVPTARHDDDQEEDELFAEYPHPGFGDIPRYPEIAHDEYGPAQRWHEETSPVALPPAAPASPEGANYTAGPRPGTAAAAGQSGTHPCPPPLPGPDWAEVAQFAANNPGREPFAVWEIDQFVDAYNAITGGAS